MALPARLRRYSFLVEELVAAPAPVVALACCRVDTQAFDDDVSTRKSAQRLSPSRPLRPQKCGISRRRRCAQRNGMISMTSKSDHGEMASASCDDVGHAAAPARCATASAGIPAFGYVGSTPARYQPILSHYLPGSAWQATSIRPRRSRRGDLARLLMSNWLSQPFQVSGSMGSHESWTRAARTLALRRHQRPLF